MESRLPVSSQPRVLITAGPTHEPIDRVRFVGNRSSGRMGLALTRTFEKNGWPTTLLLGPVEPQPGSNTSGEVHRFRTAAELESLIARLWPKHDLLIMAAAVADFTIATVNGQPPDLQGKLHRQPDGHLTISLRPTPDLVANAARHKASTQTIVGFALEDADGLARAADQKLRAKGLDAIVANPLETMDSPDVTAIVIFSDGRRIEAPAGITKDAFAHWLLEHIQPIVRAKLRGESAGPSSITQAKVRKS